MTRLAVADETRPLMNLDAIVEHQGPDRVAKACSSGWIQLASFITSCNVHAGEIARACYLSVMRRLEPVGAVNGALWDGACAVSLRSAPSNFKLLAVSNCLSGCLTIAWCQWQV